MIHTLTLNPAIDRILYLNHFKKNVTNRIRSTLDTIGGKGTHVSINLKLLGQDSNAFGVCHGENGLRIMKMLEDYDITVHFNHYADEFRETRTNYLLIEDSTDCTIAAESGVILTEQELSELIILMKKAIRPGDYMVFSGDASNSPDSSIYNRIMRTFREQNLKFFLDTSGDSLKECIQESPYMIKPNLDELSTLVGYPIPNNDYSITKAIHKLEPYDVKIIAVSLGGDGSIIKAPEGLFRVRPPKVTVQNTIGCGDSFLAGFVYGLSKGFDITEVIRIATAVSAATAESSLSAGYELDRAMELKDRITIEKIG